MAESSKSLKRPLDDTQKPALRKMRAVSGFNVWHREYLQSNKTRRESLSAANKESSLQWQSLSEEEKQTYKDKAKAVQSGETRVNVKKECKKILGHLQEVSEHAESLKECHVMYVVVHKDNHFVGGTEGGVQFIKECGAYVPYSFIGYLSAKQSGYTSGPRQQTGSCDKNDLRKGVESLFNDLYSQYVNTKARLPYSKIEEFGIQIKGLPSGASLKHPSSYGKRVLQGILDQRENLTLYASKIPSSIVKPKQGPLHVDNDSLTKPQAVDSVNFTVYMRNGLRVVLPSSYLSKIKQGEAEVPLPTDVPSSAGTSSTFKELPRCETTSAKPSSTAPLVQDHTYFKKMSTSTETKPKRDEPSKQTLSVEAKVSIMQNQEPIGTGIVAEGRVLHGRDIPDGYIKLIVEQVVPNIKPMFTSAFDDEEETLSAGKFAVWPENAVKLL